MIGDSPNRKQKRVAMPPGAPAWMATFADLATILLSFFVLLLSFSEMDVAKYKQIAGSMREAFGVQRIEFARDTPKGTSFVMREFSPGRPQPNPLDQIRQMTSSVDEPYLNKREGMPLPITDRAAESRPPTPEEVEAMKRLQENLERIRALLAEEIRRGQVEVQRLGMRIVIRIRERGSFASGSARLIEPFQPVVDKIGQALSEAQGDITIAGHTDNVPIRNERFRSNWELSAARAVTLFHRLGRAAEIDPQRVTVEGHADTRPVASNETAEGRARNRRVEVVLVHGTAAGIERSAEDILRLRENEGEQRRPAADERG